MPWWAWLLTAWAVLAALFGIAFGRVVREAERRDWIRRGRPERRADGRARSMVSQQPDDMASLSVMESPPSRLVGPGHRRKR
ncbi:hypothetical protein [Blastococcus sp. SYSU D00813]